MLLSFNSRCRSAFKLLEIDEKYRILNPGDIVIDCGAAPGSWSQIAADKVNVNDTVKKQPRGLVIAVDRQQIYNINVIETKTFILFLTITNILGCYNIRKFRFYFHNYSTKNRRAVEW